MRIDKFTVENLESRCVTDSANPRFSVALSSQNKGVRLEKAVLKLGDWSHETTEQILGPYTGERLKPFTSYEASITAYDNYGETDSASVRFETGRMNTPWQAE